MVVELQLDTVLCVLHLNIYYEKLFLFLWFWMFFVAMVSTANFFFWTISTCVTRTARRYDFQLSLSLHETLYDLILSHFMHCKDVLE